MSFCPVITRSTERVIQFVGLLLLLCLSLASYAVSSSSLKQSKAPKFFSGSSFEKLKAVTDIVEDQYGFIWIATTTGLFKYDGITLTAFPVAFENPSSLPDYYINQLLINNNNQLLIATASGLARFDYSKKEFSRINIHPEIPIPVVTDIIQTKSEDYWVATANNGVLVLDSTFNFKLKHDSHESNKNALHNNSVMKLVEDTYGNIWIGTTKGLNKFDVINNVLVRLPPPPQLKKDSSKMVYGIHRLGGADIVVSFFDQSFLLDLTSNSYSPFLKEKKLLTSTLINSIISDKQGNHYVGTRTGGLNILDENLSSVTTYFSSNSSNSSLISNTIKTLMLDSNEHLWIGTTTGVQVLKAHRPSVNLYRQQQNDIACLSGNESYAILGTQKNLYIGVAGGGFHHIELNNKKCEVYGVKYENSDFKLEFVTDIEVDKKGNAWLGNLNEGLLMYSPLTRLVTKPKVDLLAEQDIVDNQLILDILVDSDKVWMALYKQGAAYYDTKTNQIVSLHETLSKQLGDSDIGAQSISKQDNMLWLGTQTNGLISLNLKTNQLHQYKGMLGKQTGIPSNVTSVFSDQNTLWIGTLKDGLFELNTEQDQLKNFRDSDGLAQNSVWSINKDSQNNLWLTTSNGMSIFNIKSKTFTNLSTDDGLQSLEGTSSGFFDSEREILWTGGTNGINRIDTNIIQKSTTETESIINNIRINNVRLPVEPIIGKAILEPLTSNQNTIEFKFLPKEVILGHKAKHRYRFAGNDWVYADLAEQSVAFANLAYGKYQFEIQSSSNNQWNSPITSVEFHIAIPWYRTYWAYFCFLVLSVSIIYLFSQYRNSALINKAKLLEKKIQSRTQELSTEKEKVEKLLSRKNEEFANISHEFRTPLTLILGPVRQLVNNSNDIQIISKLNIVQRNAIRLLRMVDQLLNLETFRVKAITQKSPQAIGKITQLVAEAFADLAEEKQITFSIGTIEPVCFDFTPDAFEKIILNLLSNAIKYTRPGGAISISATRYQNNRYKIQVSDTGIGIAKDKLEKVFERFNRVMDENSEQVTGSGIGLALVKSLVESHDGSVELESELGQGTTITVTLPIINEVDESQINVHQNDEIIAMELMNVSSSGLHESSITQSTETIQSAGKPTVLVIEDNDDMRQYIVESIGQQFNTLVAADGQAGLELAIQEVPDLIISDIMMPKLDGYQTTKALREAQITNHIPVVLLTARGDRDSRLKGWEEKADEYITKPFDVEELIIRISNLIEIRNILKRRFSETVFEQTEQARESLVQEMDGDSESLSIVEINTQKLQQEFINQLNQQIESVYMNAELGVIDLAKSVNMSERQFYRKLKSVIDMTPSEYLRRFRLEKSKEVLRSGKTANFTAFEVGFSSQAYFSKCFKAQYNLTPKQFINQK